MLEHFSKWLGSTSASAYFASTSWIVPTMQSIHIVCVAIVFASMSMLSFRLLGITGRGRSVSASATPVLWWLWPALIVLLLTGTVMVIAEPERELLNETFLIKMLLVAIAAVASALLRRSISRNPQEWDVSRGHGVARAVGGVFLTLWIAIIICGRWIAYTQ